METERQEVAQDQRLQQERRASDLASTMDRSTADALLDLMGLRLDQALEATGNQERALRDAWVQLAVDLASAAHTQIPRRLIQLDELRKSNSQLAAWRERVASLHGVKPLPADRGNRR